MAWTSPRTWVAGENVTAALMNTHVRDNLKAIGDAWTSYTPTLSGWTLGNGTLTGKYIQAGKLVRGRIEYTVGSTDTKSGAPMFSLPATPTVITGATIGTAGLFDTSAAARGFRFVLWSSASSAIILATENDTRLSPTAPWTWATGDQILIEFSYEAS